MKVYEQIVISIATGAVLSEQAFEYLGPVAHCGGSGGGGYEPDKEYNDRIATIAEQQAEIGTEMWNYYQYGVAYNPNETTRDQIGTERKWVGNAAQAQWGEGDTKWDDMYKDQKRKFPELNDIQIFQTIGAPPGYELKTDDFGNITGLSGGAEGGGGSWQDVPVYGEETTFGAIHGYDPNAQVSGLQYEQAALAADLPNVAKRSELEGLSIEAAKGLVPLQEQTARGFYDAAINGVDPAVWGQRAQSSVEQAFQGANADARREAARMGAGLNPKSGNYANEIRQQAIEKARLGGSARAQGTQQGETENFRRLGLASQATASMYGGSI